MALFPDDYEAWRAELWGTPRRTLEEEDETCCPLPLLLQDLCLLVVVNDVNSYPVELLSSLPRWLRSRLLAALPALQLFGLESSPIAEGIDVDELWKARVNGSTVTRITSHTPQAIQKMPGFQLEIGNISGMLSSHFSLSYYVFSGPAMNNLANEIKSTIKVVTETENCSAMKAYLLEIASNILSIHCFDLKALCHKLISIHGDVLLSSLQSGSLHQPCENSLCSQGVWNKQATALATRTTVHRPRGRASNVQLTPHDLVRFYDNCDPTELLSMLFKQENLQPSSASVHIEAISESILNGLCAEQLSHDCGGRLPSDEVKYMSIMNHFLTKVVILRLKCDRYRNIGVMLNMVNAATIDGQHSKLKHLLCTLPDMFMDIVQPFSKLFTLQNFYQLTLEVDAVYPLALSKLLQAFMTAPCTQTQKLVIFSKKELQFPTPLKVSQLASLTMAPDTPPPCSVQHKTLEFSSQKEFTNALYLILQFPRIRLKELALVNLSVYHQYLHFCAMHPDLQTTKLVINLRWIPKNFDFLATTETDLISLIKMPLLEELCVTGAWGKFSEVKRGVSLGLQGRSKSDLPPLRKLALELESAELYEKHDIQTLCDSLFSLAELEKLTIVFGKGFVDLVQQHDYEDIFYRSWLEHAQQVKLKSITMQAPQTNFEKVALIVQELLFSQLSLEPPPAKHPGYYHDFSPVYVSDSEHDYYDDSSDSYCGYYNYDSDSD